VIIRFYFDIHLTI